MPISPLIDKINIFTPILVRIFTCILIRCSVCLASLDLEIEWVGYLDRPCNVNEYLFSRDVLLIGVSSKPYNQVISKVVLTVLFCKRKDT